jgi:hypothetical protein
MVNITVTLRVQLMFGIKTLKMRKICNKNFEFEILAAVTMKRTIFWDVMLRATCHANFDHLD